MISQQQPIPVEPTALVTIPFDRYMSLKNVEMDKERYAQHIQEHNRNLDEANLKITDLEGKLAEFQQGILDRDDQIKLLSEVHSKIKPKAKNVVAETQEDSKNLSDSKKPKKK